MKRFLLVRHGETDWNREGRIQGWAQASLNETGRTQAASLATDLHREHPEVGKIVASDLPRAAETADIIHAEAYPDAPLEYDAGWRERDFGIYQGYDSAAFFQDYPEFAILERGEAAAEVCPEKGESYVEFQSRIQSNWHQLAESVDADEILVVAHGGVIRVIVALIEGIDIGDAIREIQPENASVTEVLYDCGTGEAKVVRPKDADQSGRKPV